MKWTSQQNRIVLRGLLLFIVGCIISCKKEGRIENNTNQHKSFYPKCADSIAVMKILDDAKWLLYCINIDRQLIYYFRDSSESRYFVLKGFSAGMLDLQFCKLSVDNFFYSVHFIFKSSYGKMQIDERGLYDLASLSRVGSNCKHIGHGHVRTGIICDLLSINRTSWWQNKNTQRIFHPVDSTLKDYVRSNFNDIDVWFRAEAIKRGVISPFSALMSNPPMSKLERVYGISDVYKNCDQKIHFTYDN